MELLRSSLLRMLLAVLLLGGMSEVVRGECSHFAGAADAQHAQAATTHGCCEQAVDGHASHDSSGKADHASGCHCVCHQVLPMERLARPFLVERGEVQEVVFVEAASLPPEALPLGIEHPPQLA